jgi:F0F1-type ATP synthase alpha subunit
VIFSIKNTAHTDLAARYFNPFAALALANLFKAKNYDVLLVFDNITQQIQDDLFIFRQVNQMSGPINIFKEAFTQTGVFS